MQLIKQDKYKILSEKNRISLIIKPPIRGDIFDINKNPVAINKPSFRVILDKNISPNYLEEIELLKKILNIKDEEFKNIIKKVKQSSKKIPKN